MRIASVILVGVASCSDEGKVGRLADAPPLADAAYDAMIDAPIDMAIDTAIDAPSPCRIRSDFATDIDGWTAGQTLAFEQRPTGGNPDGHLFIDNNESGIVYVLAPSKFHGDLGAASGGTFSFDGMFVAGAGTQWSSAGQDYGWITITGGGSSAQLDVEPDALGPPVGSYRPYSVALTAAAWGVSQSTWDSILADVTEIKICVEARFGEESHAIDNITLACP